MPCALLRCSPTSLASTFHDAVGGFTNYSVSRDGRIPKMKVKDIKTQSILLRLSRHHSFTPLSVDGEAYHPLDVGRLCGRKHILIVLWVHARTWFESEILFHWCLTSKQSLFIFSFVVSHHSLVSLTGLSPPQRIVGLGTMCLCVLVMGKGA